MLRALRFFALIWVNREAPLAKAAHDLR